MALARTVPAQGASERSGLYPGLLGAAWGSLAPSVRRAHADGSPVHLVGSCRFVPGRSARARLLQRLLRLPRVEKRVPAALQISPDGGEETWSRELGDWWLVTTQRIVEGRLRERIGCAELEIDVIPEHRGLRFRSVGMRLCLPSLSLPVPRRFRFRIEARETAALDGEGSEITIRIEAPGGVPLLTYSGRMHREEASR